MALFAFGPDGVVYGMRVLAASAERVPLIDVEPFASDKKVLPDFFRPAPHEPEVVALAILSARVFPVTAILQLFQLVLGVQVVTKAPARNNII